MAIVKLAKDVADKIAAGTGAVQQLFLCAFQTGAQVFFVICRGKSVHLEQFYIQHTIISFL